MILLNFAHPLTTAQRAAVERYSGQAVERVIEVKTQLDHEQPFVPQVRQVVETVELTPEEWQTLPLVVQLSYQASMLLRPWSSPSCMAAVATSRPCCA